MFSEFWNKLKVFVNTCSDETFFTPKCLLVVATDPIASDHPRMLEKGKKISELWGTAGEGRIELVIQY